MAYQPNLDDFNAAVPMPQANGGGVSSSIGYQPTLADFNSAVGAPSSSPGILSDIGSGIMGTAGAIDTGAARMGGNVLQFLGKYVSPYVGGGPLASQAEQTLGQQAVQNAPQVYGQQNPNLAERFISGVSQYAPFGFAGPVTGGALYGATQNPNNPVLGAAVGGTIGKALDVAPGTLAWLKNKIFPVAADPNAMTQQILGGLHGGNPSLEENAKSLASDIQNAYKNQTTASTNDYAPVFNTVGNQQIYNSGQGALYPNLENDVLQSYDRSLNKMHNAFIGDPTFQNAHELNSQFGSTLRKLNANQNQTMADRSNIQALNEAQGALQGDMQNFLQSKSPALSDQYNLAQQNFAQNVAPYRNNPTLQNIAEGNITNPKNIHTLFARPNDDMQSVLSDLPPSSSGKILYSYLGQPSKSNTPNSLVNAINNLDSAGLESYGNPNLSAQAVNLNDAISQSKDAQNINSARANKISKLLGGALGYLHGGEGGAALGSMALPRVINNPITQTAASGLGNAVRAIYPAVPYVALPGLLNQNEGQ